MGKVMLEGYECERCQHRWLPRATTEETPTICPKCKSPYWNRPRKAQRKKQIA
jgi:predicted Zn-ribbon and HTH transcriptional regulator